MKIEEVLHLFTKVEDGLPEHNGWYQVVDMNYYPFTLEMLRYKKYSNEWTNASGDFFHPQYWLDMSKLTTKSLPDPYAGNLNEKRIQAYHKIANMYTCSPSSVRDIFCAGIDWYKSELEKL